MRDHLDDVESPTARRTLAAPESQPVAPPLAAVLRLQRDAGNQAVMSMLEDNRSSILDVIGSGGSSLPEETRTGMEARFGADFSSVRLHTGQAAAASAQSVQAKAYTVGDNVVLGAGVDPASASEQRTLAHELTHVLQQRAGEVDGTAVGGIRISDPRDTFEQEAEHTADRILAGDPPVVATPVAGVHREAASDEEEAQADLQITRVQREDDDQTGEF